MFIIQAEEESDDVDEGREVDYMTDTDSEDDEMYTDNVKTDKYEETGKMTCSFSIQLYILVTMNNYWQLTSE